MGLILIGLFFAVIFGWILFKVYNVKARKPFVEWIEKYENDVMGLVYFGAALLIFLIGLRGLGTDIPSFFLIGEETRLNSWIIVIAVGLESLLILLMAATNWAKEEEHVGKTLKEIKRLIDPSDIEKNWVNRLTHDQVKEIIEKEKKRWKDDSDYFKEK
jgi:hypothetical protein